MRRKGEPRRAGARRPKPPARATTTTPRTEASRRTSHIREPADRKDSRRPSRAATSGSTADSRSRLRRAPASFGRDGKRREDQHIFANRQTEKIAEDLRERRHRDQPLIVDHAFVALRRHSAETGSVAKTSTYSRTGRPKR